MDRRREKIHRRKGEAEGGKERRKNGVAVEYENKWIG